MINPKKTIPKLAGAILALTGAQACGGDGGTATREDINNVINSFCMKVVNQCGAPYTMQECTGLLSGLVNSSNGTPQCYGAILSYANCLNGLNCDQIYDTFVGESYPCGNLYDPVYYNC